MIRLTFGDRIDWVKQKPLLSVLCHHG